MERPASAHARRQPLGRKGRRLERPSSAALPPGAAASAARPPVGAPGVGSFPRAAARKEGSVVGASVVGGATAGAAAARLFGAARPPGALRPPGAARPPGAHASEGVPANVKPGGLVIFLDDVGGSHLPSEIGKHTYTHIYLACF